MKASTARKIAKCLESAEDLESRLDALMALGPGEIPKGIAITMAIFSGVAAGFMQTIREDLKAAKIDLKETASG